MSERDYFYSYTLGIALLAAAARLLMTAYRIYTSPSSRETTHNESKR